MAQLIKIGSMFYSDLRIDGKRVRRALSRYKPEAKNILKEMVEMRRSLKHGDVMRDMSWKLFRDEYLKYSLAEKNPTTYRHDKRSFQLVDAITYLTRVDQLTPNRLSSIRVELINKGKYTKSCIARGIRGMITAMKWAEERKYVQMQNWGIVQKLNKEPEGRKDFYRRNDYLTLLSRLQGDWFTAALIMGRAGLRLGEMLHLEWSDIDFENRIISFRSKPHIKSSKNPDGWRIKKDDLLKKIRYIPMLTADLRQHLEAIRRPSGFVLSPNVPRREDAFSKKLTEALIETGIKTDAGRYGHPHILRHTFASHLAQVGVPLKKIAEWMGHESVQMTEGYSHLCPKDVTHDIKVVEKLCSTFDPVHNSIQSFSNLLGSLDPKSKQPVLSSKHDENSH